jgi:helicase MOV-10
VSCGYRLTDSSLSIVKLLNNYRSHPAIIRFPSERFYDGELEACGEPSAINSCLNLELLGPSKYPVIFSAVEGHDMREASSPSFFNPEEVLQVKAYVQQLLADTRAVPRIGKFFLLPFRSKDAFSTLAKEPAHIGIIAPYRAQCTKLRKTLRHLAPEIKIGSVEEYQGDVSRVLPNVFLRD